MKRFLLLLSVIFMVTIFMPKEVNAEVLYGLTVEESSWQTNSDGGKYISQTYSVTSTKNGYVYLKLLEVNNVKIDIDSFMAGSSFTMVSSSRTGDNEVTLLLKAKDGVQISGKTELFTVLADIVDPSVLQCSLGHSPLNPVCVQVGQTYFDKNGAAVSESEYRTSCEGYNPPPTEDIPNTPDTGSVIPYIAIGLGIVAIAGLYIYSKKSNKMFKI